MKGPYKHWSRAEEQRLCAMLHSGLSYHAIAARLERSLDSCQSRARNLRVKRAALFGRKFGGRTYTREQREEQSRRVRSGTWRKKEGCSQC